MTTSLAWSIGIWQESVGLSGMIGGMTMHVPEIVAESDDYKILWGFSIQTGHEIGTRRPDLVIVNKRDESCQIIDVAIPEDGRVREKEDTKVEKYQDLAGAVWKMWDVRKKVIPVDCLQSSFSLKIRLVLISSSAIANHDVVITIRDWDETRREKTDCWLFCNKQNPRQPRNGVIDWSTA